MTRRTVARGAAWTVPVIALASAAPASAASAGCTVGTPGVLVIRNIGVYRSEGRAEVDFFVQMNAKPVCTGGATSVPLTLTFTLDSAYKLWMSDELTPFQGQGVGTFSCSVRGRYERYGDDNLVEFMTELQPGAQPTPITFTLSAPGAPSVSLIAFE